MLTYALRQHRIFTQSEGVAICVYLGCGLGLSFSSLRRGREQTRVVAVTLVAVFGLWSTIAAGETLILLVVLPIVVVATAVLLVGLILEFPRFARDPRRQSGACPVCGYDLRASPERCPECGTVRDVGPDMKAPSDAEPAGRVLH